MCDACQFIAYDNPKILVACIASWQDKVLWMKRATEPQRGYWAIPSGFMESGETPEQAAARELHEETRAHIDPASLNQGELAQNARSRRSRWCPMKFVFALGGRSRVQAHWQLAVTTHQI